MQNEKNIADLKSQLLALGFAEGLESGLRAHICLGPERFTLRYRRVRQGDVLNVSVLVEQRADQPLYSCPWYDACLRRPVDIPALRVGEVDSAELEARMKEVDWQGALCSAFAEEAPATSPTGHWQREEAIERIVQDLNRLEASPEGVPVAHRLKIKYWSDTPLEGLLAPLAGQKSRCEITQRFYLFEGEGGLSLEEAYRFLCHRFRERQWLAERRQALEGGMGVGEGRGPLAKRKARTSKR